MPIRNDAHRDEFHRDQQWHKPVRVATTANVTIATALNAGDTIDGVVLAAGDRVLVKSQSAGAENGIYVAGASPARAYDMLAGIQALGAVVRVLAGTANGQTWWQCTNATLPTIGSTSLTWTQVSFGGTDLGWFNVKDYGAIGDDATDDRTSINNAIADLNSAGRGVLYFPAGRYYVSDALTAITVPCLILGDGSGMPSEAVTQIRTDHATANLFTLSNYSIHMRGLRLYNSNGSETDGCAVTTTTGFGTHNRYTDMHVDGFRDGMKLLHGGEWSMVDCHITNPVRYGVYITNADIPDGGDWSIVNTWFHTRSRDATAAIRQESAGGGKLANVKVNCNSLADQGGGVKRYVDGISTNINGSANNTTVMTIVGSSFENVSGDAIDISTTGTGRFGGISISACEFGLYTNNSGRIVKITAAATGGLSSAGGIGVVTLDGLTAITDGTARAAIELTNTDRVTIGELAYQGFNARYTSSGDTNTTDATTATLTVEDEGTPLATAATTLDFVGAGVTASGTGAEKTITIAGVTAAQLEALGAVGAILISDDHSTPILFADILLTEAGDDILYADLGG